MRASEIDIIKKLHFDKPDIVEVCKYALRLQALIAEIKGHTDRWNQESRIAVKVSDVVKEM